MSSCGTACEWRPRGPDPDRVVEESLELIGELTKKCGRFLICCTRHCWTKWVCNPLFACIWEIRRTKKIKADLEIQMISDASHATWRPPFSA